MISFLFIVDFLSFIKHVLTKVIKKREKRGKGTRGEVRGGKGKGERGETSFSLFLIVCIVFLKSMHTIFKKY